MKKVTTTILKAFTIFILLIMANKIQATVSQQELHNDILLINELAHSIYVNALNYQVVHSTSVELDAAIKRLDAEINKLKSNSVNSEMPTNTIWTDLENELKKLKDIQLELLNPISNDFAKMHSKKILDSTREIEKILLYASQIKN